MSTKGLDQTKVGDNTHVASSSDQTGHILLDGSGAYTKSDTTTPKATASSGSSWDTAKGFLNLLTGEVMTGDKTSAQLRTEEQGIDTAHEGLSRAAQDFKSGNNDLGVQDYKQGLQAMEKDPNMARQALHAKIDLGITEALGYVPFFGQRLQESMGNSAAGIDTTIQGTGNKVNQALGHLVS